MGCHLLLQGMFLECSRPRDWTHVSCITGRFFTAEPPGKARFSNTWYIINQNTYIFAPKGKYTMFRAKLLSMATNLKKNKKQISIKQRICKQLRVYSYKGTHPSAWLYKELFLHERSWWISQTHWRKMCETQKSTNDVIVFNIRASLVAQLKFKIRQN